MTIWKEIYDECKVRIHLELSDVIYADKGTMYIKNFNNNFNKDKDDIVIFHFELKDKNYVSQLFKKYILQKNYQIMYDLNQLPPKFWCNIEFPPLTNYLKKNC